MNTDFSKLIVHLICISTKTIPSELEVVLHYKFTQVTLLAPLTLLTVYTYAIIAKFLSCSFYNSILHQSKLWISLKKDQGREAQGVNYM